MKFLKLSPVLAVFIFMLMAASQAMSAEVDINLQKEIERNLVCQDDCGMILAVCENQTAEYMRGIIIDKLKAGQSKEQILNYFVGVYGEKVLSAPTKKGFNVTLWVTPFLAVLGGGVLVYLVLDKWVFVNKIAREDENKEIDEVSLELTQYEDKLYRELKKYM